MTSIISPTPSGNTANGTTVATYQDNGNSAQRWYFVPTDKGWYRIVPQNAGINSLQTLDMRNGNSANAGDSANIYSDYGGLNQ